MKTKYFIFKLFLIFLMLSNFVYAQLSPAWVQRTSGTGDNSDKFNAITGDAAGNFYLCGYTYQEGKQKDFLVVKTDGNGDTLWTRTYNGTNNGDDEAVALSLDQNGNIFVTGYTDSDIGNLDFLTIKYDNSGNQLWAAIYNYELAYMDDQAVAITTDTAGFVYVTGISDESITSTSNKDYLTIKYDAAGGLVFAARKNGFGNATDEPAGIVADNNGNCYVTGRSDSGNDDDYVTIKYNAAGLAQWTKLYDAGNGDDRATAITYSLSGNIIVTGRTDAGSSDDITTICYTTGGVQLWIKNFNGNGNGNDRPVALTADNAGNIYVTGESDADPSFNTNYDIVTIKYTGTGGFQWASYKAGTIGPGNTDIPRAILADNNGNVYVTGKTDSDPSANANDDLIIVKYDLSGTEQWSQTIGGSSNVEDGGYALILDNNFNPVIAGKAEETATQLDAIVVKYDQAGTLIFKKSYNGPGDFSDNAFVVKTDAAGNVFIAGYTFIEGNNRDLLVKKLDNAGNELKTFLYNGTKDDEDEATDMVLDASGNVYVTGYSKNSGQSSDFITIKLNNNLDTSWVRFYNSQANESDKAVSIALDINNNVYVTGYSDNNPSDTITNNDIVSIKYDNNGSSQWTNRYNGLANAKDKPVKICTDQNGNAIVTGESWNGTNDDFVTIKYSPVGAQLWLATYNGTANGGDQAADMVLDINGNIYITGSGFSGVNYDDYVTLKYDQGGAQQWVRTFNGTGNDDDKPAQIALDQLNHVYVTGQSDMDTSLIVKNYDFVTIQYDESGNFGWSRNYSGTSGADDIPDAITVDANGILYVGGQAENGSITAPNKDYVVVGYFPDGTQKFTAVYDGPSSGTDGIHGLTVSGSSCFVTGNSNGGVSQRDIATIKYDIPAGLISLPGNSPGAVSVFPNPANDNLNILIRADRGFDKNNFEIEIYDFMGKKLHTDFVFQGNLISLNVRNYISGFYAYCIKNNNDIFATGKFIIRK